MISKKVLDHLKKNKVKFEVIDHKKVFTAYDLAQTLKEDLQKIAKALLVKADRDYVIVVIPAHYRLDLKKLQKSLKAKKVEIAKEKLMIKVLKLNTGGMTPFGSFHKVQTWADKNLLKTKEMVVNAGSFTQSLKMLVKDFVRLEEARLGNFVVAGNFPKAKKVSKKKVVRRSVKKVTNPPTLKLRRTGKKVKKTKKK